MNVAALIVAAGRGSRAGPGAPKQYRQLAGEPVLRRTLSAFAAHPLISSVMAVIHEDDREAYGIASAGLAKLLDPCPGGATRRKDLRQGDAAPGLARAARSPPRTAAGPPENSCGVRREQPHPPRRLAR